MKLLQFQCVKDFTLKHDSLCKKQGAQLLKASRYIKMIIRLLTFDPFGPLAPDSPCFPYYRRIWRWTREKHTGDKNRKKKLTVTQNNEEWKHFI